MLKRNNEEENLGMDEGEIAVKLMDLVEKL